ncbi:MAG TPA: tRNA modification GTPase [Planctomycetaceae bacterium]|nr:tRNA modification GTPase [Planctomycetaceae bacterium]
MSTTSFQLDDTIGALASALGPAARGIVRLSGPEALNCLASWFEPTDGVRWQSARAPACHAGGLRLEGLRSALEVIVYAWPNARSYTGQPLVEIHGPGSPPLLEAALARAFAAGVRPAHPGEFTLRAFLAGRIDLLQAEAVLGVIDAAGEDALGVALRQLAGGISGRMTQMRGDLIDLLADLEAGLDFVEEGIEFVSREELARRIRRSEETVDELLRQCAGRSQSVGRRRVVLAGLPNAGKSTLFNALLSRDAALVSPRAGTTRDYLSGALDWAGLAVELVDTPGWEADGANPSGDSGNAETDEDLTRQSQELGAQQRQQADLVLWCSSVKATESQRIRDIRVQSRDRHGGRPVVVVGTKCDLIEGPSTDECASEFVLVSAKTGQNLAVLVERCVSLLAGSASDGSEILGTTAARCRESLAHCREALMCAAKAAESRLGDEIVALELRESLEHLGRVLGTVYTDDILDRIFSRFCIGK